MGTVGVAPGTTTFTLASGEVIALVDWIDDRLYGTIELANGDATPVEAFSAALSQQIPGGTRSMTKVDTNVPRAGSNGLPQSYEMLVFSIGVKAVRAMRAATLASFSDPVRLATLFGLDRLLHVEMKYRDKSYSEGVIQDYPQGHGYYVTTTASDQEIAQNGVPSPRDRNAMVLPIRLQENLGYKVVLSPADTLTIAQPASDGGTVLGFADIKTYFYGLYKRPVV
jgi:hypothetical protein